MKTINLSLIGLILIGLVSCTSGEKKTPIIQELESLHYGVQDEIELNKGEKWLVETGMMKIIKDMEKEINSFQGTEMKDFKTLAIILQEKINELTSTCTMQGKAHDELHKWLIPVMEQVNLFLVIRSEEEGLVFVNNFKKEFIRFKTYFE